MGPSCCISAVPSDVSQREDDDRGEDKEEQDIFPPSIKLKKFNFGHPNIFPQALGRVRGQALGRGKR